MKVLKRAVESLENSGAPFLYSVLAFFFAVTLRNFLEMFSTRAEFLAPRLVHYYLSYVALALGLILLFHLVTRESVKKTARVVLPAFFITSLAPVLDLLISRGSGYQISYLLPGVHENLLLRFFTFFGDFQGMGATPGMRIEIALVLVMSFFYFWIKMSRPLKSLFSAVLVYAAIFLYGISPFFVRGLLELLGLAYVPSDLLMADFFLVTSFFLVTILFYLANREYFRELLRDSRLLRIAHYEIMFFLGIALGPGLAVTAENVFHLFFIPVSIAFALLFSVVTNNIADHEIDMVSNRGRPHVKKTIKDRHYLRLGWAFLVLALVFAGFSGPQTLFFIVLFTGNYFLYSMPPLRLKRVTFFSKIFISLNSLVLVILGFVFAGGSPGSFPPVIALIILTAFTAATNFIDIKDYRGDKRAGIKTLPVVLGLEKAKLLTGFFFVAAYLSVILITGNFFVVLLFLGLSLAQFWLVNRKNYDERPVFLLYLFTLLPVFLLLSGF